MFEVQILFFEYKKTILTNIFPAFFQKYLMQSYLFIVFYKLIILHISPILLLYALITICFLIKLSEKVRIKKEKYFFI